MATISSLTPLAWRMQDAEERLAFEQARWARLCREAQHNPAKVRERDWAAQDVNDALDALDALRGEAGL